MPKQLSLKELTDIWYSKLKNSGFQDAENRDGNLRTFSGRGHLKHKETSESDATWYAGRQEYNNIKQEYYYLAEHFLNSHRFSDKTEKQIWKLHSEGVSYRNIAKELNSKLKVKLNKDNVNTTIKRLSSTMVEKARRYGVSEQE